MFHVSCFMLQQHMAFISEFKLREQMCDIGRRIWLKGFCAGNEGNHSFRMGPNKFLCTPTGISKGNLKPDDLCVVDATGRSDFEIVTMADSFVPARSTAN